MAEEYALGEAARQFDAAVRSSAGGGEKGQCFIEIVWHAAGLAGGQIRKHASVMLVDGVCNGCCCLSR